MANIGSLPEGVGLGTVDLPRPSPGSALAGPNAGSSGDFLMAECSSGPKRAWRRLHGSRVEVAEQAPRPDSACLEA